MRINDLLRVLKIQNKEQIAFCWVDNKDRVISFDTFKQEYNVRCDMIEKIELTKQGVLRITLKNSHFHSLNYNFNPYGELYNDICNE